MQRVDAPAQIDRIGRKVQRVWREAIERCKLPAHVTDAFACLPSFEFDHDETPALNTLFTREMLKRGFLAKTHFSPMCTHTDEAIARYAVALDEVFSVLAEAVRENAIADALDGPVAHGGFQRLL